MLSPLFPVAHSVLQSSGDQGGIPGALTICPRTAQHHFAHCLFTLHVAQAGKMEIKCIYK